MMSVAKICYELMSHLEKKTNSEDIIYKVQNFMKVNSLILQTEVS